MDKKIVGLLGAIGALASLDSSYAAVSNNPADPTSALEARSYSDLLEPIPNAVATLRAIDASTRSDADGVQVAQYYDHHHHHHHHHHNSYGRYRQPRVIIVPRVERRYRGHHHHHHHHNSYYRRYRD